jgi:hypothetical protein
MVLSVVCLSSFSSFVNGIVCPLLLVIVLSVPLLLVIVLSVPLLLVIVLSVPLLLVIVLSVPLLLVIVLSVPLRFIESECPLNIVKLYIEHFAISKINGADLSEILADRDARHYINNT